MTVGPERLVVVGMEKSREIGGNAKVRMERASVSFDQYQWRPSTWIVYVEWTRFAYQSVLISRSTLS